MISTTRQRVRGGGVQRGHCHGGGAVAALRLKQDIGGEAELPALLGDDEPGFRGGDHGRLGEHGEVRDPLQAGLEGRSLRIDQPGELFGHALARGRPQAGTGAPAQDHGLDLNIETQHQNRPLMRLH